jgi:hypothetical protein
VATSAQRMERGYADSIEGSGWVGFAGIMLTLVGFFNIIDGIAAIADSKYLVNQLLFSNLHAWGWFFLIFGVVQVCAGFGVMAGAGFNAIAQLSWARAYPVWAIVAVVADVLVIYALVVYGGQRTEG